MTEEQLTVAIKNNKYERNKSKKIIGNASFCNKFKLCIPF